VFSTRPFPARTPVHPHVGTQGEPRDPATHQEDEYNDKQGDKIIENKKDKNEIPELER